MQHENYNLTIHTHLDPLYSETYNNSFTYIKYTPANGKAITSMKFVQFNMSVILSQQYDILADITEEMAKIYKLSKNEELMELLYAYITMANEIKLFSQLVKEHLLEYDWQILESFTVLTDEIVPPNGNGDGDGDDDGNLLTCIICIVACELAVLVECIIACFAYYVFCYACEAIMDYMEALQVGCEIACEWLGACS